MSEVLKEEDLNAEFEELQAVARGKLRTKIDDLIINDPVLNNTSMTVGRTVVESAAGAYPHLMHHYGTHVLTFSDIWAFDDAGRVQIAGGTCGIRVLGHLLYGAPELPRMNLMVQQNDQMFSIENQYVEFLVTESKESLYFLNLFRSLEKITQLPVDLHDSTFTEMPLLSMFADDEVVPPAVSLQGSDVTDFRILSICQFAKNMYDGVVTVVVGRTSRTCIEIECNLENWYNELTKEV